LLRRAMGKKKADVMAKERDGFVEGCAKNAVDSKTANDIFDLMEKFADYGFNKCLARSAKIVDARTGERTTIGSLVDSHRLLTIHALDDSGRLRPRAVIDVVANGPREVFELRTAQGKRIKATANHPFRTLDGWKQLESLRVGDRIAAPRKLHIDLERSWPVHELVVLGGLLSEGNTCHPNSLYFFNNRRDVIEDFAAAANRFPDTVARIDVRTNGALEVCVNRGGR